MKLTPILDDGFEDDTAPSTPYVSRPCIVHRAARPLGLVAGFFLAWIAAKWGAVRRWITSS